MGQRRGGQGNNERESRRSRRGIKGSMPRFGGFSSPDERASPLTGCGVDPRKAVELDALSPHGTVSYDELPLAKTSESREQPNDHVGISSHNQSPFLTATRPDVNKNP